MRPRLRRGLAALAVGASVAAVLGTSIMIASTPTSRPRQTWIATATTIGRLERIDASIAHRFFDTPTAFGLGGWASSVDTMAWASETQFASDLHAGLIPPEVDAVMYDPENWDPTPVAERRDPVTAMRAFASLAHAHGYLVIITPHPNLTSMPGAACERERDERIQNAYLRCGIGAAAARHADIVEVQAQFLENDVGVYRTFVTRAAVQALTENADVRVLAGLSTNFTSDPMVLFDAWASVRDVVDGHYMAVPKGVRPQVATSFLELVAERLDAEAGIRL